MAESNPPSFMQNVATQTAAQARNLITSLVSTNGVGGTADLKVTQRGAGANMTVDIAGGRAFVPSSTTGAGTYNVYNDATVNKAIATADATNPRWDLVCAKVEDAFYAGAVNAWSLVVVTGTPAGSPALPAAPVNYIPLAKVVVAAAAASIVNANITDLRTQAAALGGVPTFVDAAARDASLTAPSEGQFAYLAGAIDALTLYNGTAWVVYAPNVPWTRGFRLVPGGIRTTTSGSYENFPTDTASLSITKHRADTRLVLVVNASCFTSTAGVIVHYALRINGVDNDCSIMWVQAGNTHGAIVGGAEVTGLAAGAYTAQLRWKRSGAAGTVTMDTADNAFFSVTENL